MCPLGVFQDGVNRIAQRFNKKKRFSFSKPLTWLRLGIAGIIVIAFLAGLNQVVSIIDPYSIFGRAVANLLSPLYKYANNGLAYLAERADSYAFYRTEIIIHGGVTLAIAVASILTVSVMAWLGGRSYCNTVCPVGTVLGFLAKYSFFKPRFNPQACNSCGLCERACKSSCINSQEKTIDYSRCVTCFNCIDKCNRNAMSYQKKARIANPCQPSNQNEDLATSRRNFLGIAGLFTFSALKAAGDIKMDGGLAVIEDKKIPRRETKILPAGSDNAQQFTKRCTACQLCVSVCHNHILRPSNQLDSLMQPFMSFERGYCRPECVKCSEVCPSHAISPVTREEKSSIKIGSAVWIKDNCFPFSKGVKCNNCARNCPAGAIQMILVENGSELAFPSVDNEMCIGCGACEFVCPSRPFSAMYVEGLEKHRFI
jgi:ferredoxin